MEGAAEGSKSGNKQEELKAMLFKENVRLQTLKSQLEAEAEELKAQRREIAMQMRQLAREKRQLSIEMNQLRQTVEYERKRLKDDERMLDKKQKIIQRSFALFDDDKRRIREEYARIERTREELRRAAVTARKEVTPRDFSSGG